MKSVLKLFLLTLIVLFAAGTGATYSGNVPSGKIGAMYFIAKYRNDTMRVIDSYTGSATVAAVKSPAKLSNGLEDGLCRVITRNAY